jgi:hypothetical protein
VRCTRLNNRQPGALNDEKIICHPRRKLVKTEMPGLAPGIFILRVVSAAATHRRKKTHQRWIEARQKDRDNSGL